MSKSIQHPGLPLTVTRAILKTGKTDHSFRKLLYDLFTISSRIEEIRSEMGRRIDVSGPQMSLMLAVAELGGEAGVSVGRVGEHLHVTGTFVTIEAGKLKRKGYLIKRSSDVDGRVTLLSLSPKGIRALKRLFPELQQINDIFFDLASQAEFYALCKSLDRLVNNSQRAVHRLRNFNGI
jgi:DNA-binding MarR family transcriptional regulator